MSAKKQLLPHNTLTGLHSPYFITALKTPYHVLNLLKYGEEIKCPSQNWIIKKQTWLEMALMGDFESYPRQIKGGKKKIGKLAEISLQKC